MAETKRVLPRRAMPLVSTVTLIGFLDTTLLVPIVAVYAKDLGAGVAITGLIVGLYSIVNTPANVLFGRLIDRIGFKLPLSVGLAGDAVAMLLYSLCRLPLHLALVRAFHGFTGAAVGPATMSAISVYSSGEREGRSMSVYGMSIAAANLLGFGLSGMLYSRLGNNWLFAFGAVVLAAGFTVSFWLPGGGRPKAVTPEAVGPEVMSPEATQSKSESANPLPSWGLTTIKRLLRRRGLVVAYGAILAQYFSFGGLVTLLPREVERHGMDALHMGMLLVVFSVVFIAVQFPAGAYSDRRGRRLPIVAGLAIGAAALLALPLVSAGAFSAGVEWPVAFGAMAAVMAVYGVGYGLLFPSVSALVVDESLPEERGVATAGCSTRC
ncbi:MAG: MFS transporter [Dehalococcoidales bacterium]